MEEALKRAPQQLVDEHMMRCKRAQDLQLKYKVLPDEIQALQQPDNFWLRPYIEEARLERLEAEELNEGIFSAPGDRQAMLGWSTVARLSRGNYREE